MVGFGFGVECDETEPAAFLVRLVVAIRGLARHGIPDGVDVNEVAERIHKLARIREAVGGAIGVSHAHIIGAPPTGITCRDRRGAE